MHVEKPIELRHFIILGFLSLIWGSSFILMKKALISFAPYDLACLRLAISGLAFVPVLLINRKNIPWNKWKQFLAVGLTGSGVPAFMYFIAQTNINSIVSGLLNSLTPIWTLIIGILVFQNKLTKYKLWGVILGFIGAALLLLSGENQGTNKNLWYGLFVVAGTLCYGMSGNLVKHYFQNTKSVIISAVSFILIGAPCLLYLLIDRSIFQMTYDTTVWYSMGAVIALAVFGTVMSTIIFYKLIQETTAVFGSSVAFIIPLVAILWGFLDGEGLGMMVILSMALILSGVYLIKK